MWRGSSHSYWASRLHPHPYSQDHSGWIIDTLHVILVAMSSAPPRKGYLALASPYHCPKVDMTIDGEAQPMFILLCLESIMVRYSKLCPHPVLKTDKM